MDTEKKENKEVNKLFATYCSSYSIGTDYCWCRLLYLSSKAAND